MPAYNEAAKIQRDLALLESHLSNQPLSHEVIVVDDGSTDATHEHVTEFSATRKAFRGIRYEQNRGKGHAIKTGVLEARGTFVLFVDAGSCVPYRCLDDGLALLRGGCDVAIGSRALPGSKIVVKSPLYRRLGSQAFGLFVRRLVDIRPVRDTQCGFKLFRLPAARRLMGMQRIPGFMFDIELIANAKRLGYRIGQFPVEWSNDADTRFAPIRGGGRRILSELMRIRWYQLTNQYNYGEPSNEEIETQCL